ncbi:hypothetical protein BpHYR1_015035 [Brachionus plicatilis]|uniref:Uncharacterized protein n=1 Tax=Brachionus plicatilis TaxID=10195 RepID=A0A3M7QIT8_BRAPC|nr:hypothetical protein BpHYR1_015035 [Brachionus plicatilis]
MFLLVLIRFSNKIKENANFTFFITKKYQLSTILKILLRNKITCIKQKLDNEMNNSNSCNRPNR